MNSVNHYSLVHKFIPMLQAMKIPDAKAAVVKEWEPPEKSRAWKLPKVRNTTSIDLCHLKNSGLELRHQKHKGKVVFRVDIVKDDSCANAVFIESGSSASQMTAAKVMDTISRLPGCAGQAAYAVSADTQVKMEDAPTLLKIPK